MLSNQPTTETKTETASNPKRYVIRAKGTLDSVYWTDKPYEEHGVTYHWATHPSTAAQFDDLEIAEGIAKFQPKHANPEVVSLDVANEEHSMPPASFPFTYFNIATDAEMEAAEATA